MTELKHTKMPTILPAMTNDETLEVTNSVWKRVFRQSRLVGAMALL